jgi:hypothetical protein
MHPVCQIAVRRCRAGEVRARFDFVRGRGCARSVPKTAANLDLIHFLGSSAALLRQNSSTGARIASPWGHLIAEIRVADRAVQNPAYILGKQNIF